jgi:hypothetical protein
MPVRITETSRAADYYLRGTVGDYRPQFHVIDIREVNGTHRFVDAALVTYEPAPDAQLFHYPTYAEQSLTFEQRPLF